jgi:hypothetical protein
VNLPGMRVVVQLFCGSGTLFKQSFNDRDSDFFYRNRGNLFAIVFVLCTSR